MHSSHEDLSKRLKDIENLASQGFGLEEAKEYAGAILTEIVIPLEAINNLLYLLRLPTPQENVGFYLDLAQVEVLKLNDITKRSLKFCNNPHL